MKNFTPLYTLIILGFMGMTHAQQVPGVQSSGPITLSGATAHIGDGTVINDSRIVIDQGRISAIGGDEVTPRGAVIDVTGQHVYPGIIAPVSSLGLVEIDAIRQTRDDAELGEYLPNIRSIIAYNAESRVVESMRPNGVLLAQTTPQGGTISGTSSIVQLDAWNWEDAAVKLDDGIHLHWPDTYRRGRWWMGESRGWTPNKKYGEQTQAIATYFQSGISYTQDQSKEPHEAFKALKGVFDGSKTIYLYADGEREIVDAVSQLKDLAVKRIVLVGGYEAHKIIPFLKAHEIPVIVDRVHATPAQDDDDYDQPFKLPKLLVDGGLLVGLNARGSMERMSTRNLPFYAGHVAGQGLAPEEALKLVTANTAKILGIEGQYGTLTQGKSATLFVSRGDALDMRTNQLTHAFIDGRVLSLETHQTELYERYSEKYGQD
ncbi:MAG: amidohydrolase [Cryomorphaceae bacterium BACL21 MAG-121220-bin10]|jgi:imidazolonepropionase-like amidohydrolase|nr:MAG: amidohydrolase [Cryomorphaceae bacterium BACL21 MAG-121220-bin10]